MPNQVSIDWSSIRVVIFDVDGTLYNQTTLRDKMKFALLKHYMLRPWRYVDLRIISVFRKERDKLSHGDYSNLEEAQFEVCARKTGYPIERVKQVIRYWMFNYPLRFLDHCKYPGVVNFFEHLKEIGINTAIYSDFEAVEKLNSMGIQADLVLSSTDSKIDSLKPNPKALLHIARYFDVRPDQCLFIGDRDELDGQCARNAKMPYLILDTNLPDRYTVFETLLLRFKNIGKTENI